MSAAPHVSLRPVGAADEAFVHDVTAAARADVLALTGWPAEQSTAFVEFHVRAQTADYQRRFPESEHQVVLVDGAPAGRFWTARDDDALRLLDVMLLPAYQGRGVGTVLLRGLQDQAARGGVPVLLTVSAANDRAFALYLRLGFVVVGTSETHRLMEWVPDVEEDG